MFKKLNFTLDIDFERIKNDQTDISYGKTFTSYAIKDMQYFNDLLSRSVKFNITPSALNYTEILVGAGPHVDGPFVVLNYYLQTNRDATLFWKPTTPDIEISELPPSATHEGVLSSVIIEEYDPNKLKLVNYFVAKDHDAYLFDVSCIHSVSCRDHDSVRRFIRIFWENTTFEEVLNSIEILPK
jgi:hypothetical protein